jgi:hypothetical protein
MPSAQMCVWEWKPQIFLTNNPGLERQFSLLPDLPVSITRPYCIAVYLIQAAPANQGELSHMVIGERLKQLREDKNLS